MIFDIIQKGNCFITGEKISGLTSRYPLGKHGYVIEVDGKRTMIQFDLDEIGSLDENSPLGKMIKVNGHIFRGLIYNNRWLSPDDRGDKLIDKKVLEEILKNTSYPKTPAEKKEKLFFELASNSNLDGGDIIISGQEENLFKKCYFRNKTELGFYILTLREENLIDGTYNLLTETYPKIIKLTFKGLSEYIRLNEEGVNSNRCFVAMSFDSEDESIFQAIKQACYEANKYDAFLVKDEHLESSQTINDGIIAAIKKSKFCIADFTKQKDGVYFESGYAVGRGMKVIYTCRKDWFQKSHFDTNHFPHIIYETDDELKQKLVAKIQAWVD